MLKTAVMANPTLLDFHVFIYAVVAVIIPQSFGAEIGQETLLLIDIILACKVY